MKKTQTSNNKFWQSIANIILGNRLLVLICLFGLTYLISTQWKYNKFSFTEANLLPKNHPINKVYNSFLDTFGEEGNIIIFGIKDSALFQLDNFKKWNNLNKTINAFPEVDILISTENLKILKKDSDKKKFIFKKLLDKPLKNQKDVLLYKEELLNRLPFYKGLLYNNTKTSIRSILYLDKEIVNTNVRRDFIFYDLNPLLDHFEKETGIKIHTSGMPYIRTMNTKGILKEIKLFIICALLVTSLMFYFFFRSMRATIISMLVVVIGVMWAFGILGFLRFEITVLTALIPPLVIVIGIPNCIFLINRYQQEISNHGNKVIALKQVVTKIGNATFMTNLTTSVGFATFIITESDILKQFGIIASINILIVFILSLIIIPCTYSFIKKPKNRHLKHLQKRWINTFINWMIVNVKYHRLRTYILVMFLLIISIIGVYKIKTSGSLLDDIPQNSKFAKDIRFFEKEYSGIMPLEITIDTKRKRGALRLTNLKRVKQFENYLKEYPDLQNAVSVLNIVKYAKQAFYNGNPKYFDLPTSQENNFILSYTKSSFKNSDLLKNLVNPTGEIIRITSFMKDINIEKINRIETNLLLKAKEIFPEQQYDVTITGKPLVFAKGTAYLIRNLILSLTLAILLISLLTAYTFRSFRMILICLIPNLLSLLFTAGLMGYLNIPLKPSTILVFSIAFGISVDDTLHFLAKYRQELQSKKWHIKNSVYTTLRETGVSMFYTSIVLFFGFSVFMISEFGGTIALGGLVSITLLFAMLLNLILLPSLLLSLEKDITNKKTFKSPNINLLSSN